MTDKRDKHEASLPDNQRLTNFGKKLRAASLDELPCFWNVIRCEMALVGPRPFIADYLELYSKRHRHRHDVCPGITGWAQVNGRNSLSWHEKFELDLWYIENRSIWLDIKIIFLTLKKVFLRREIDAGDDVTKPTYNGHN